MGSEAGGDAAADADDEADRVADAGEEREGSLRATQARDVGEDLLVVAAARAGDTKLDDRVAKDDRGEVRLSQVWCNIDQGRAGRADNGENGDGTRARERLVVMRSLRQKGSPGSIHTRAGSSQNGRCRGTRAWRNELLGGGPSGEEAVGAR